MVWWVGLGGGIVWQWVGSGNEKVGLGLAEPFEIELGVFTPNPTGRRCGRMERS